MKFHYVYREEFNEIAKILTDGRTEKPGPRASPPLYAPGQEENMRRSEEGVAAPNSLQHFLALPLGRAKK